MKGNVIITGISRGLGKSLFELFISKGYMVFGILRNPIEAEKLKRELPENGKIILSDLSSDEPIKSIRTVIGQRPIDLLINNAGIGGKSHLLEEIDSDEINDLFNIHCVWSFLER